MYQNKQAAWQIPGGTYSVLASKALEAEHTLIAGETGCGKTSYLRAIMRALLVKHSPSDAKLILIDPKQFEIMEYEHLPHVIKYVDTISGANEALKYAVYLMEERARYLKQTRQKVFRGADIYIIIDELNDLLISKEYQREIKHSMERIITLGRALKIHLISCTQNPNRATIPANIVSCYTCRIGMKCLTSIESRQIVGIKGCESLPKHGEVIAVIDGSIGRYKAPDYIPEDGLDALIRFWEDQAA